MRSYAACQQQIQLTGGGWGMVIRRRPASLSDPRPAIDAMGRCRKAMVDVSSKVLIGGPIYDAAAGVMRAIDAMAKLLVGDETHYHAGGSAIGSDETKWREQGK